MPRNRPYYAFSLFASIFVDPSGTQKARTKHEASFLEEKEPIRLFLQSKVGTLLGGPSQKPVTLTTGTKSINYSSIRVEKSQYAEAHAHGETWVSVVLWTIMHTRNIVYLGCSLSMLVPYLNTAQGASFIGEQQTLAGNMLNDANQ